MEEDSLGMSEQQKAPRLIEWDKMTDDQKLKATKQNILALKNQINHLHQMVNKLREHQHGPNGTILCPAFNMLIAGSSCLDDEHIYYYDD